MKNRVLAFSIALALFFYPAGASADTEPSSDLFIKFGRGLVNIVAAPMEYVIQYEVLEEDHNAPVALIGSVLYGTLFTVARILGGVYEVVTFPVPLPRGYAPLMNPPTPIESLNEARGARG